MKMLTLVGIQVEKMGWKEKLFKQLWNKNLTKNADDIEVETHLKNMFGTGWNKEKNIHQGEFVGQVGGFLL